MNKRVLIRLICLIFFAAIFGFLTAHDVVYKQSLGRDAYLAAQGAYFDKTLAHSSGLFFKTFAYVLLFTIPFALYEGLVFVVELLFGLKRVVVPTTAAAPPPFLPKSRS